MPILSLRKSSCTQIRHSDSATPLFENAPKGHEDSPTDTVRNLVTYTHWFVRLRQD